MASTIGDALSAIPAGLRDPLISEFDGLLSEYRAGDWEKVGLKAGKLCEVIYCILKGYTSGAYPSAPSKPANMVDACKALESAGANFSRSARIQIPRMLVATYELRNNRAIGHVGGDVDPNHMDAELFLRAGKWMVAELMRIFSSLSTTDARALIESVTEKILPAVWENAGRKKVLNASMSARNKALVLAYSSPGGATAKQIFEWSGYSNLSRFRSTILKELSVEALIDFDPGSDRVTISPTGSKFVETSGLLIT